MARPNFDIPENLEPKKYKIFLDDFIDTVRGYSSVVERAEYYATMMHKFRRYNYNDHEYSYHLKMVHDIAKKHIEYFPEDIRPFILAACWTHDIVEDCGETYNDVKDICHSMVAKLSLAVTNIPDENRELRSLRTYPHIIKAGPYAIFVKCCDRLANTMYSKETSSGMYKKYKDEYPGFRKAFYKYDPNNPIWMELDLINGLPHMK